MCIFAAKYMKPMTHRTKIGLFLCFCTTFLHSQSRLVESLSIEQGLSQGMIFDLCQTKDGFLWIATKDGLNRFDGYNFTIFNHDPFDRNSLAENTVTALLEDSRGWLWVGTESTGMNLYDRRTGGFRHIPLEFGQRESNASFEIFSINETPDGNVFVLQNDKGLISISLPRAWRGAVPPQSTLDSLMSTTLIRIEAFRAAVGGEDVKLTSIETQEDGAVWVHSSHGPYLVDSKAGTVALIPEAAARLLSRRSVWGSVPGRIFRFKDGRTSVPDLQISAPARTVFTKTAENGSHWIAVNNQIWHLAPDEMPDFAAPDWAVDADVSAIETDHNGNIWIGTMGYGLRKINPKKRLFKEGASGKSIWGLWRDSSGRYFCKVVNEVYPYDPARGTLGAQPAFPKGPPRVLDIHMESDDEYWLLGRGEEEDRSAELCRYNFNTGEATSYPFPMEVPKAGAGATGQQLPQQWFKPYVYSRLLMARDGRLWATSLNCELARFAPQTGRFERFNYRTLFGELAANVRPFAMAEDGNGVLWIGTQLGLVKATPIGEGLVLELIKSDPRNPAGLNNNSIACLLPDPSDNTSALWIGTKGGGITRLDLCTGQMTRISTKDGLPDNVIYGILPGKARELWCSSNRGLARLRLDGAGRLVGLTAFTAAKGLQDNEFNTQAFYRAPDGELLFGGVNGLNRFFPQDVLPDTIPSPVSLVGLRINQRNAAFGEAGSPLSVPLDYLRELQLNHDQNNLTFEFAVLDFTDPSRNRYRYQLEGADREWVETGTSRFAYFTHLPPGQYTLCVEGNNGEGAWQSIAHPIKITVLPPWWRSNLAYLLYLALLVGAGWQAYHFQIKRVKEREQLAFEHRENERIRSLERVKANFFSNVTHEFRTPLTLMIEPLRQMLQEATAPGLAEKIKLVQRNSQSLLGLVNQLLDLAKLEGGQMSLDIRRGNLCQIVRDVFERFLPLAEKRGIKLTMSSTPASMADIDLDPSKVELVLNNLLSNALKFTPRDGSVKVDVSAVEHASPRLEVSVTDTGIGIPSEEHNKIFGRFYRVDNADTETTEGTGIGLALSREMALLMGGGLSVESSAGQGAVFTFWLPATHAGSGALPMVESFAAGTPPQGHRAAPATMPNGERPIVLVIEDNAELRTFICQSIGAGWQIATASDGEEGIAQARALLPDLVISDLMMPRKDGYAVCDELKNHELTAHIPIILLTAKAAVEAKIKGLRSGADDYLTKPFNTDELLARMENLVRLRKALRQGLGSQSLLQGKNIENSSLSPLDKTFLRKLSLLIEEKLDDETLGVEDFAKQMFISRVQLHRKLKALTDQNATEFIRDYRLERALTMLQNKEGLVADIAMRVGFKSEKYFSTVFKKKFGVSPSQVV